MLKKIEKIDSRLLEGTTCLLCGDKDQNVVYNFKPYKVIRCCSCGLHYLSPRLTENTILKFYKNGYFQHTDDGGYLNYVEQKPALQETFRHFLENLKRTTDIGNSLLEVGCGYGYLLEEAKHFFNMRVGTDLSQEAINEARQRADKVYLGGIEQLPSNETFDCIIANQVIEHIYHPIQFLKKLSTYLNPEGIIVLSTPNIGSFWKILMQNNWPSFKIPEHVAFFDKQSLGVLMQKVGLVDIKSISYPHAFPVTLILSKLKLKLPFQIKHPVHVWLPATTIALCGRKPPQ